MHFEWKRAGAYRGGGRRTGAWFGGPRRTRLGRAPIPIVRGHVHTISSQLSVVAHAFCDGGKVTECAGPNWWLLSPLVFVSTPPRGQSNRGHYCVPLWAVSALVLACVQNREPFVVTRP